MNADRLLEVYEQISEAPDAIARLRRFVLDLAVRGKLVEQDAADEPASSLARRLSAGKENLIKSKVIKKPRNLGGDEELIQPYVVPESWLWSRLDSVGAIVGGGTPSAGDSSNFETPGSGVAWLTPADLGGYSRLYISRGARDLSEKGLSSSSATLMPRGTVLFTSRAPIGYVAIAENPIATNQGFKSVVPFLSDCSQYIALTLKALATEIDAKASGTTFKEVSGKTVAGIPFPLPPLAEQHRIVAKVDELMALCDRLEDARKTREEVRDKLTAASLARLTAPDTTAEDFPTHAAFALEALPALTTRPDQIKTLRQTILNLAVRGKLVEQDADDEAIELPDQDQRRKAEGKLKVELPDNWRWASVSEVANARLGKMLDKGKNKGNPYPYLGNTNVHWFDIRTDDLKEILLTDEEAPTYLLEAGDVLICEGGHGIGRTAVWRGQDKEVAFQKALHRVRPSSCLDSNFFAICSSVYFDEGVTQTYFTGVGIPHFTGKALARLLFPLPPLAEQHRIVAKVDALMALCDRLEAALTEADTTRTRLLEALLHEALEPAAERVAKAAQ